MLYLENKEDLYNVLKLQKILNDRINNSDPEYYDYTSTYLSTDPGYFSYKKINFLEIKEYRFRNSDNKKILEIHAVDKLTGKKYFSNTFLPIGIEENGILTLKKHNDIYYWLDEEQTIFAFFNFYLDESYDLEVEIKILVDVNEELRDLFNKAMMNDSL